MAIVVAALDRPLNPKRIERFLTLAYNGGLAPLVVVTKADRHPLGANRLARRGRRSGEHF